MHYEEAPPAQVLQDPEQAITFKLYLEYIPVQVEALILPN